VTSPGMGVAAMGSTNVAMAAFTMVARMF